MVPWTYAELILWNKLVVDGGGGGVDDLAIFSWCLDEVVGPKPFCFLQASSRRVSSRCLTALERRWSFCSICLCWSFKRLIGNDVGPSS